MYPSLGNLLIILSALLSLLGCSCLALSQEKHALAILGKGAQLPAASACRRWAFACLLLALVFQLLGSTGDFVIVLYPMFLGVGALIAALAIAFSPDWLRPLRVLPGLSS
jgi:type III secretory pathway component EscU